MEALSDYLELHVYSTGSLANKPSVSGCRDDVCLTCFLTQTYLVFRKTSWTRTILVFNTRIEVRECLTDAVFRLAALDPFLFIPNKAIRSVAADSSFRLAKHHKYLPSQKAK